MCDKSQGPPANGASLDRFLNGPFVKMSRGHFYKKWKYFFGPIPWQAAEIIGGLLAIE